MTSPLASVRSAVSKTALVLGVALLIAACGNGESNQPGTTDAATDTTAIEVTMTDYAYTPARITVPAGKTVTLEFTNEGTVEHYFVVGDTISSTNDEFQQNLFSGVSIEKRKQTEGHEEAEEEGHEEEHHENEFELPPGGSGSMTFTLPASKAGTYTIACFETAGGDTHYQRGMEGTLTVSASDE